MDPKKELKEKEVKARRFRTFMAGLWRVVRYSLASLVALFFALYVLIQIPVVQNWLANKITNYLSAELQTHVQLDHVSIEFFDKLVLEGLYVEDLNGDTLLYSYQLKANINTSLFALMRKRLEIEEIFLTRTSFFIRRGEHGPETNLQFLLDYFTLQQQLPDAEREPLRLSVHAIYLQAVQFSKEDAYYGSDMLASISSGQLRFRQFDLPGKKLDATRVFFREPLLRIRTYEGCYVPEQVVLTEEEEDPPTRPDLTWTFCVDQIDVSNGHFILDNLRQKPVELLSSRAINYQHLDASNIQVNIRAFSFEDETYAGRVERIAFDEHSGFSLSKLAAQEVRVSPKEAVLNGLELVTPKSTLGDTLAFYYYEYSDFLNFVDGVRMDIRFHGAEVAIDDILVFASVLEGNEFFSSNRKEVLTIDGQFTGRINSLRGRDLNIRLAKNTYLKGDFSSFNLAIPDIQSLNLRLNELVTDMQTLRQLFPNFNLPANFNKLGRLNFTGSFDGFFTDFVAYGDLRTRLGRAVLDMRMNTTGGREKAQYSGNLRLINFNLGAWTESDQVGNITFSSRVIDGVGLTGASANARLEARIDSMVFRDYMYENLTLKGQLNRNLFDGDLSIQDDNIDFEFAGTIDFTEKQPFFNFNADVRKVDLQRLNITKEAYELAGGVALRLRGFRLSEITGNLTLSDIRIVHNRQDTFLIDSIDILSLIESPTQKTLLIESDLLQATVKGHFNIDEIPFTLIQYFERNYSGYASRFNLQSSRVINDTSHFSLKANLRETKDLPHLLDPRLGNFDGTILLASFNSVNDSLFLDLDMPSLQFANVRLNDVVVLIDGLRDTSDVSIGIYQTQIGKALELAPINLLGFMRGDTLEFAITAFNFTDILNDLEINGQVYPQQSDYIIHFDDSDLIIFNEKWEIRNNNYIRVGKEQVRTRNFELSSRQRRITLESMGQKGLFLNFRNFELENVNEILRYKPTQFAGNYDVQVQIANIFQLEGLSLTANLNKFLINEDEWGSLRLDAQADNIRARIKHHLTLTRGAQELEADGYYNPPNYQSTRRGDEEQPNYLDLDLSLREFPLRIAEYWIGTAVSDTKGTAEGNIRVFGPLSALNINGGLLVHKGEFFMKYLNTRYFVNQQRLRISNQLFDATDAIVTDELGNQARITGGITHQHLRKLGLAVRIQTDRFLVLNTRKGQNDLFYGTAIGSGDVRFQGSFLQPEMIASGTTGSGTRIVLPISYERDATEVRFIRFAQKDGDADTKKTLGTLEASGLQMELNINMTPDALVEMVFDEQAGDILKGSGRGNLRMLVPRVGDFEMYGDFEVESGEYLFTLMNVVNKPFVVTRGGSIQWSGDPYSANLNIAAEYKGLKAPISNFIAEYLAQGTSAAQSGARIPTEVDMTMKITGELLSPTINFDINFPNLLGELKNFTDNKLRIVRQDQNEMNRQVFGLLVIGQFLPSNFSFQGQELNIAFNTVTEMLSQQLSIYLTSLVSEWLTEDGFISGIDFDIAFNHFQSGDVSGTNPDDLYRGNELQVRLNNYLFDDRLSVNVGGNFDLTGSNNYLGPDAANSGIFFAGDLSIEYFITPDRNLKVRFYQSTSPEIGGGRRNRTGMGLRYRKEFDSFSGFLDGLRKTIKGKKEKQK
jgi:hypothetical protein